jgi:hypothetical protein
MRILVKSIFGRPLYDAEPTAPLPVSDVTAICEGGLTIEERQAMSLYFYQYFWYALIEEDAKNEWDSLPYEKKRQAALVFQSGGKLKVLCNRTEDLRSVLPSTRNYTFLFYAQEDRERYFVHPAKAVF